MSSRGYAIWTLTLLLVLGVPLAIANIQTLYAWFPALKPALARAIAAAAPLESANVFVPGRAAPGTAAGYQAPAWVENVAP